MDNMNWAAVSAIISALTLICVVGPGLIMWGIVTEKVSGLTKRADDHKAIIAKQADRLSVHDVQIGRLEEWKDGYNAAVRTSGRVAES